MVFPAISCIQLPLFRSLWYGEQDTKSVSLKEGGMKTKASLTSRDGGSKFPASMNRRPIEWQDLYHR